MQEGNVKQPIYTPQILLSAYQLFRRVLFYSRQLQLLSALCFHRYWLCRLIFEVIGRIWHGYGYSAAA